MPISQIYLSYYRYVIINFEHVVNFEKKEHNLSTRKLIYSSQAFSVLTKAASKQERPKKL